MLNKRFLKPEISIHKIGRTRFRMGIVFGLLISFLLSIAINYSRESLRIITFTGDLFILPEIDFKLYDFFFASISSAIGMGVTLFYWLRNRRLKIKKSYFKTLAISNIWLTIFVILMVITRFGTLIFTVLYGYKGYDKHFDFIKYFWPILILLPVLIFYSHWNVARLIFRVKKWPVISAYSCIFFSFILYNSTSLDKNHLNKFVYRQNPNRFEFIDNELLKAEKNNIHIGIETKEILSKYYAERTTQLVHKAKKAFSKKEKVAADTLIIEKIFIHNRNITTPFYGSRFPRSDKYWPYAYPEDIFAQIKMNEINSYETKILFEILQEQSKIILAPNLSDLHYMEDENKELEQLAWDKFRLMRNTQFIEKRLINVIHKILNDNKYSDYHHLFPSDLPPPIIELNEIN